MLDDFQIDFDLNEPECNKNLRINNDSEEKKSGSDKLKDKTEIISLETDSCSDNKIDNPSHLNNGKTRIDIIDGFAIEYDEPEEETVNEEKMLEKQINNLHNKSLKELDIIMRNLYDELLYNDTKYTSFNNYFYKLKVFKSNRTFNLDKSIIVSNCEDLRLELEIEKIFSTVGLIQQLYINRKNDVEENLKTLLKYNYYSQLISNIHEYKDQFLENNSKYLCLLKENEILIEYVDSVSCDLAVESFKFTKIKGKNILIRYAVQKIYNPIYLRVEGLDKEFISESNLRSFFTEFSKKIIAFTFDDTASHFYISVQNNKTAKLILNNFHNKQTKLTDCILKIEIVPEIYIKIDKERWMNNGMIGDSDWKVENGMQSKLNNSVQNEMKD